MVNILPIILQRQLKPEEQQQQQQSLRTSKQQQQTSQQLSESSVDTLDILDTLLRRCW